MTRALDRAVLALAFAWRRGLRRKDREVSLRAPSSGPGGYEAPVALATPALAHTGERGGLSRRCGSPWEPLARFVATAAVALVLPAAAFSAGMGYAGERADQRVAQTQASYEARNQETVEVLDARDICLAEAEARGGGHWAGQWARLMEDPDLAACYAEEAADAARIRAEAEDRSFRSGP